MVWCICIRIHIHIHALIFILLFSSCHSLAIPLFIAKRIQPHIDEDTHKYILYLYAEITWKKFVANSKHMHTHKHTHSLFVSVIRQQFYILYQGFWRFDLFTVVFLLIAILLSNLYALYCRLRFKALSQLVYYIQQWIVVRFGTNDNV